MTPSDFTNLTSYDTCFFTIVLFFDFAGFLDKAAICCGYHKDNDHVWCGNKGKFNGTEVYADSCKDPSLYISWDGVHYTEAANHWLANHILNGSFSDPQVPISRACYRH